MREALARSNHDSSVYGRVPARAGRASGAAKAGKGRAASRSSGSAGFSLRAMLPGTGKLLFGGCALLLAGGVLSNALMMQDAPHPAPLFAAEQAPATVIAKPAPVAKPVSVAKPAPVAREQAHAAVAPQDDLNALLEPPKPAASLRVAQPAGRPAEAVPAIKPTAASAPAPARSDPIAALLRGDSKPAEPKPAPKAAAKPAQDVKPAPVAKPVASAPPAAKPGASVAQKTVPEQSAAATPLRPVASAQRALAKLGYGGGALKVDGLSGPGTREAIERFEKAKGLPVTGELSARTVKALTAATGIAIQ